MQNSTIQLTNSILEIINNRQTLVSENDESQNDQLFNNELKNNETQNSEITTQENSKTEVYVLKNGQKCIGFCEKLQDVETMVVSELPLIQQKYLGSNTIVDPDDCGWVLTKDNRIFFNIFGRFRNEIAFRNFPIESLELLIVPKF